MPSTISIENFRGFSGRNEVQLSPLTLVTGPPNSGKSTLLFAMAAASELARGETPDFNRQPLQLGGFAQIASPGTDAFSVGTSNNGTRIEARFREGPHGQPEWDVFAVAGPAGTLALSGTPGESPRATWSALNGVEQRLPWTFHPETPRIPAALAADALRALLVAEAASPGAQALLGVLRQSRSLARLMAPQRVAAQRTYNPRQAIFDPFGSHVAPALAALIRDKKAACGRDLDEFGREAGYWDEVCIRRLGRGSGTEPFQIELRLAGRTQQSARCGLCGPARAHGGGRYLHGASGRARA